MLREIAFVVLPAVLLAADRDLAKRQPEIETRWASFENPAGAKGLAARDNHGAKGHAWEPVKAGETKTLMNVHGAGTIRRIWLTVGDRAPEMLRSLRLEMFWDAARTPAVSVPLGDFFGAILGRTVAFQSELFANPEGRSFQCFIPMPFRTGARVTLTNDSKTDLRELFYDIDYELAPKPDEESLYFHAWWHRERPTTLGQDFEILPRVRGEGRFLGAHIGVITNPENVGWWGEGEVKMYVDGDRRLPTLAGTGTEDYAGSGWGLGTFQHRYSGSLISDEQNGRYAFYRYHVPDAVYFHKDLRVTIQQMGGADKQRIIELMMKGAVEVKPVSISDNGKFTRLLDLTPVPELGQTDASFSAWVNVYRRDDWSAVALFYLDAPVNGLPKLAPVEKRVEGLTTPDEAAQK